ncbi:MAG: LysR family transcriptional regulator [Candidatus Eisenbacteria bacterium]|nr:LysR family transcriptional regulator [Candidatus Eisenbacteria bacterium]
MKGIDLFALRCLDAAARSGSLTAAARALGVSQPAVSIRVSRLERQLGVQLLARRARGVALTAEGRTVLERARKVLDELRSIEGDLRRGPLEGTLRFGSTDVILEHRLPPLLRVFRKRHPGVGLELVSEGSLALAEGVRAREIEFALATLPIPDPPGPVRPLFRDRLCFVASPTHPLAGRRSVSLREISEAPLLAHKRGSVTRDLIEGYFVSRGLRPRVAMEVSSPEVMRTMARGGLGVAVLPEIALAEDLRRDRLAIVTVRGWSLDRLSGLLLPPGGAGSRAGRAFLRLLDRSPSGGAPAAGAARLR